MKLTIVPAQITTVEDRIIGSLGFSQMLLLVLPVFATGLIFICLPPFIAVSDYKYWLSGLIILICVTLSFRVKEKIIANWLVVLLTYNLRPKYYVFDKNSHAGRKKSQPNLVTSPVLPIELKGRNHVKLKSLDLDTKTRLLNRIVNPASQLRFEITKKGDLHVRLQ